AASDPVRFEMACNNLAVTLGAEQGQGIQLALEQPPLQMTSRLLNACSEEGTQRAVPLTRFSRQLFGSDATDDAVRNAARGLLLARGACTTETSLPSLRLHWFFR